MKEHSYCPKKCRLELDCVVNGMLDLRGSTMQPHNCYVVLLGLKKQIRVDLKWRQKSLKVELYTITTFGHSFTLLST
jgi:hypothetical protein